MTDYYLIALDRITDEQRQLAHEVIKSNATGWWHRFQDVWIAGGRDAAQWRDLLVDVVGQEGPTQLLVFALGDGWASYARSRTNEWIQRNL